MGITKQLESGYIALLEEEEGGGFVITIPTLPGCITSGNTQEEALDNLEDCLSGWLEACQKHNIDIPPPP